METTRHAARAALLAVTVLTLLAASAGRHRVTHVAPAAPAVHATPVSAPGCTAPTPTTAAGYQAMFDTVPTSQWGGADVGLSVRVGGYNVWLWGDTISNVTSWPYNGLNGRMVHSSAITQRYGCLHVSQGGRELLPSQVDLTNYTDPAKAEPIEAWFWIKSAAAIDGTHFLVTADHVQRTGPGVWDFKVVGQQTAHATILTTGDVVFDGWLPGHVPVPVQNVVKKDGAYPPWSDSVSEISNGKILVTGLPHSTSHFSYSPFVHPETRMASGKTLLTVATNSTPLTSYSGYKPLWLEVTL